MVVRPLRRRSCSSVLNEPHVHRIEPGRRLVEHAQLGIAQQHRGDLHLLRHALAQTIDFPGRDVRQLDPLQPLDRPPAGLRAAEPFQRAEIGQHVGHAELGIEAALLRQVSESIEMLAPPRLAEDTHLAASRRG